MGKKYDLLLNLHGPRQRQVSAEKIGAALAQMISRGVSRADQQKRVSASEFVAAFETVDSRMAMADWVKKINWPKFFY